MYAMYIYAYMNGDFLMVDVGKYTSPIWILWVWETTNRVTQKDGSPFTQVSS